MPRVFFDTETTGVPKNYKAPLTDFDNWPRVVQLAYIVTDNEGNPTVEKDFIVYPTGFEISDEVAKIHGITQQIALEQGKPLNHVLGQFISDIHDCDTIVGHNLSYDESIIGCEMLRQGAKNFLEGKQKVCTMKQSTNFCAIPNPRGYGYKWPKLQELYFILFKEKFEDAHNALNDIRATIKCYNELKRLGVIYDRNSSVFKQLLPNKR